MPLAEELITGRNSIQAYQSDQITINERNYHQSLILSATEIISPWSVTHIDELNPGHLQAIVDQRPEVILLGTGDKQQFPDIEIIGYFADLGLGLEVMDTGAACRTFNILVAEHRQVVAGIILDSPVERSY
jgi:uncharacterized protein